ncbi:MULTISPECIES: hypothetical protein [Mumia]|nr:MULTISPECIES: hypothetical protein [unclassified Mumia]
MRFFKKHHSTHTPRFPAYRTGNGNRDRQRIGAELDAMRVHSGR